MPCVLLLRTFSHLSPSQSCNFSNEEGNCSWAEAESIPHLTKEDEDNGQGMPLRLRVSNEEETGAVAEWLADEVQRGDVICLYGDVGAGKTTFSRHFIRALASNPELSVPSPTFLLQNVYGAMDGLPVEVHHFDLYRLSAADNFSRLGLGTSFSEAVSLIEWPDRLQSQLPRVRLNLSLTRPHAAASPAADAEAEGLCDSQCRILTLTPCGKRWIDVIAVAAASHPPPPAT